MQIEVLTSNSQLACIVQPLLFQILQRGRKLTGIEVEQSRCIANLRIHVERMIGAVRQKFTILSATHPIEDLHDDVAVHPTMPTDGITS